jgi:hypothetical protein
VTPEHGRATGKVRMAHLEIGRRIRTTAGAFGAIAHITTDEGVNVLWVELDDGSLNASLDDEDAWEGVALNRWPFAGCELVPIRGAGDR